MEQLFCAWLGVMKHIGEKIETRWRTETVALIHAVCDDVTHRMGVDSNIYGWVIGHVLNPLMINTDWRRAVHNTLQTLLTNDDE